MKLIQLKTPLSWKDLQLNPKTKKQLKNVDLTQKNTNYLFTGPSGTGKTLAVTLLSKEIKNKVHYVKISLILSKYIGETEKNIAQVFDTAEKQGWILFFDEADALFGKRANIRDAHSKYANQETSYLLQRIEDFKGIVILSTHLKKASLKPMKKKFKIIKFRKLT